MQILLSLPLHLRTQTKLASSWIIIWLCCKTFWHFVTLFTFVWGRETIVLLDSNWKPRNSGSSTWVGPITDFFQLITHSRWCSIQKSLCLLSGPLCLIHEKHVVQINHNSNSYSAIIGFIMLVSMRGPDARKMGDLCIVITYPSKWTFSKKFPLALVDWDTEISIF